jgi:murein DD-endopeptidase MepM/ murein hydrolase activator NlpD
MAMLTELEFIMLKEFRDMQELTDSAEKLIPYSRARPTGWPTASGAATSGFGNRRNPFDRSQTEYHTGVDIQIPYGSPVYATADGVVAYSARSSLGYGNLIIIDHAYGYSTLYAHNSSLLVAVGTEVERGQLIAYSGNSGRSLGSHLHYEVRRDNIPLNPQPYM